MRVVTTRGNRGKHNKAHKNTHRVLIYLFFLSLLNINNHHDKNQVRSGRFRGTEFRSPGLHKRLLQERRAEPRPAYMAGIRGSIGASCRRCRRSLHTISSREWELAKPEVDCLLVCCSIWRERSRQEVRFRGFRFRLLQTDR